MGLLNVIKQIHLLAQVIFWTVFLLGRTTHDFLEDMRFTVPGKQWVAHCLQNGYFQLPEGFSCCTPHSHSKAWQEFSSVLPLYKERERMIVNGINECWMFEAGQGVNSAPGSVVSVLTIKLLGESFLLLFILWQELSEAAIPQFAHGLQWLCNAFAPHCAVRPCPLYCWSTRVTALQDPNSVITCRLFISPLQRNRIQAQKGNITMDYILPVLYILQHPKLNFLASGLCR